MCNGGDMIAFCVYMYMYIDMYVLAAAPCPTSSSASVRRAAKYVRKHVDIYMYLYL